MIEPSRMYNYVRSRQLEGTFPGSPDTGNWPITSFRVWRGWGCPPESVWPYNGNSSDWPPAEPPGIDDLAKQHRIASYQRVRSLNDCRLLLEKHHCPVIATLKITAEWYNAPNGRIHKVDGPVIASHSVSIIDYDDKIRELKFANSWGKGWGDEGYGYIDYVTFEATYIEGWTADFSMCPRLSNSPRDVKLVNWAVPDLFEGVFHVVEIIQGNDYLAWLFAVERANFLDVEELFVLPKHRRKGYASDIVQSFYKDLVQPLGRSVRFWIPHSDADPVNLEAFNRLISCYSLTIKPTDQRWAAFEVSLAAKAPPVVG